MNFSMPCFIHNNLNESSKSLEKVMMLVKDSIDAEKEDELYYDYLASIAPSPEQKHIIASIRDDETKHQKYLKEIYKFFTEQDIHPSSNIKIEKTVSYIDGIKKSKLEELNAVKKYREIRAGILNPYYRDVLFEILTDELIHAHKLDYLLHIYNMKPSNMKPSEPIFTAKSEFTVEQAEELAKILGIDFDKENFDLNQFIMGLNTELEHGKKDYTTNVTNDDPLTTAKIALAHLREFPDYYTRLSKLEAEAKAYWSTRYINQFNQTRLL